MAKRKKSGYKDFATNQKLMYVALMLLICFLMAILLVTSAVHFNREHEEKELKQIIGKYAENGGIIYGADDSAPPLRFIDSDNVYKGIVVDYINQLALEMGTEIEAVPYTWENALQALENKEINICDMFANEERAEKFSFTDPIYILRTIIVTPLYKNYQLSDINRLTVATQKGDYANTYMRKNYPGAELIYVHDIGGGLKLLKQGKVDAVIGDEPVVSYYADLLKMDDNIHPISAFLYEEPVVLAVNKEQQDLIKPLNSAISAIKKKGQLEAIQQKWFGISTPLIEKKDYRIYLNYFIVASFLAVVFIIFRLRENMKLKKEVAKRTIELEKSHNELRLIFNEMPEGVLFLSKDKLIMNCNNPARKTLNIADGETLPVKCSRYMTPLCGSCKDCIIDRCTETGEVRFKKVNFNRKIYELRCFNIDSKENSGDNVMFTINDITLEEIKNSQLLQSSKMMAVGQLAAGMAHQIRNPLGVIRTHSYILRKGQPLDDKGLKSLDYIDDSVKRAGGIIDNVMNFWRISDAVSTKINMKEFITSIVELQADTIKKHNTRVEISCDEHVSLTANQEAMKHILLNIIQNALEAVENKDDGLVQLSAVWENDVVEICCSDNGAGICEEDIPNLFNPFFTTKPPGKGTGLGLFIAYNEVENLHGELLTESHPGKGAVFKIRIPDVNGEEN